MSTWTLKYMSLLSVITDLIRKVEGMLEQGP